MFIKQLLKTKIAVCKLFFSALLILGVITSCNSKQAEYKAYNIVPKAYKIEDKEAKELFIEGLLYLRKHKYEYAKFKLNKADEKSPNNPTILNGLAEASYMLVKNSSASDYEYGRALEIDSNYLPTYFNYGNYLTINGKCKEAIALISIGLSKVANDIQCKRLMLVSLANSYYCTGNTSQAIALLNKAERNLDNEEIFKEIEVMKQTFTKNASKTK